MQGPVVQGSGAPAGSKSPRRESLLMWCVLRSYWTVFLLLSSVTNLHALFSTVSVVCGMLSQSVGVDSESRAGMKDSGQVGRLLQVVRTGDSLFYLF